MDIENLLDNILDELEKIEAQIIGAKAELNYYRKDQKRAKSDAAKESIQQQDIDPIRKTITLLRRNSEAFWMKALAIESHVLEEEINTRQSGTTTVTKLDNRYRFKFLFSRLRRFGNFTGYLSGRKQEADNTIKDYLIKKELSEFIRTNGKNNLYSQYGIDPNSETALQDLKEIVIQNLSGIDFDERLSTFKDGIINQNTVSGTVDRQEIIDRLVRNVPKKAPSTPYLDSLNKDNSGAPQEEHPFIYYPGNDDSR